MCNTIWNAVGPYLPSRDHVKYTAGGINTISIVANLVVALAMGATLVVPWLCVLSLDLVSLLPFMLVPTKKKLKPICSI